MAEVEIPEDICKKMTSPWSFLLTLCGAESHRVSGRRWLQAMAPAWKAAQKAYIAYIGPVTFRGPDADDEQVESKLLTVPVKYDEATHDIIYS